MLVKNGQTRLEHWKMKYLTIRKGRPSRQLSKTSEEKLRTEYTNIAEIEHETKKILGNTNEPTMLNFFYLAFAREIYGLTRKYTKKTLQNQIEIALAKWQARSLNPEILMKIKDKIFKMMKIDVIL
ncbi:MAG: hypothetical protein ABIJ94_02720 [candidate division WOR-3 bacterium]